MPYGVAWSKHSARCQPSLRLTATPPSGAPSSYLREPRFRAAAIWIGSLFGKVPTKALDAAVGDGAGGEAGEGFVDVGASFSSDPQAAEAVQPGDGALDGRTEDAQAGAVFFSAFGDDWADSAGPEQAVVRVVAVSTVGEERVAPVSGPADDTGHGRNLVEQGKQLCDVIAVSAGQRHRERNALAVGEDMVPCCPAARGRPGWARF